MKKLAIFFCLLLQIFIIYGQQVDMDLKKGCVHEASHKMFKSRSVLASEKLTCYDVNYYKIDLEVNDTSTFIKGNARIKTTVVKQPIDSFLVELSSALIVDSVYINGIRHDFLHVNELVSIELKNSYFIGDPLTAQIFYQGAAGKTSNPGIFNQSHNQTDFRVTYTLSEPFASKSWFPVKQDLFDKADSVEINITVPPNLMAGSNGLLTRVTVLDDGRKRYEWKSRYPIAYYLISIAVADYQEYNIWANPKGFNDSILIQNYIYDIPGLLDSYKDDIDETTDMLNLFSELYTLYPFYEEKYGHAMAPFGGGMEHQTMTTILNFQFFLVAHELAHQWFGNNVTCATWQDIWINEGFASYSEYIAIQKLISQSNADGWMRSAFDRITSQPGGSVYVPFEDIDNERRIFDYRLSYKKGAAIIHMLRFEMDDDDLFFKTLQEFQIRFKDSVATGDDFKVVVEDMTGENWSYFFDQWYYGEGYPVYTLNWEQVGDTLFISSEQKSSTEYAQFFRSSMEFEIVYDDNSSEIKRVVQDESSELFSVPVSGNVAELQFDPNLWLLKRISSDSFIGRKPVIDAMKIVPNPAKSNVRFEFAPPVTNWKISIYTTTGKLIYSSGLNQAKLTVDTSSWSEGIYVVKAGDLSKLLTGKFVIDR